VEADTTELSDIRVHIRQATPARAGETGIVIGQSYTITVGSKRYRFVHRSIQLNGDRMLGGLIGLEWCANAGWLSRKVKIRRIDLINSEFLSSGCPEAPG
jgi:hypothetical protein